MTAYILTIVVLAIALTILEIMQTDSNISRFIRGLFSLFLLASLIAPLPKIFAGIKDGSIFSSIASINTNQNNKPVIDNDYITKINITRGELIKNAIISTLKTKGLTNFEVTVNIDLNGAEFKIYSVIIKAKNKISAANKKTIIDVVTEITRLTEQFILIEDNVK